MDKYSFSLTGEEYYDVDYIAQELEDDKSIESVYIGENIEQHNKDFLNIDMMLEYMEDSANELGEFADSYLSDMTHDLRKDLENTVLKWFDDNNIEPHFFLIQNAKEISREEFFNEHY